MLDFAKAERAQAVGHQFAKILHSSTRQNMTDNQITALLSQINNLGKDLQSEDGTTSIDKRSRLRLAATQLSRALEEPGDIVERVCFQVDHAHYSWSYSC